MTTNPTMTRTDALWNAARQASLAPSIHNTQPWRFVIDGDVLEVWADRTRQLAVLDPTGRQLMISCGCALMNARVSLAASGFEPRIERIPQARTTDPIARLTLPTRRTDYPPLADLAEQIPRRQTNRRRFDDTTVSREVIGRLVEAAGAEGAVLSEVQGRERLDALARLTQRADALENADPAYRAELRHWTTSDPKRSDGVPAMVVPHVTGNAQDDVPIRDFDTHGFGWLPAVTRSSTSQCLLVLGTVADSPIGWLAAGEALERVWLTATQEGYVASLFTQVVEVPSTRQQLRQELDMMPHPQIVVRVGRAPHTPASRRRSLADLVTVRRPAADD